MSKLHVGFIVVLVCGAPSGCRDQAPSTHDSPETVVNALLEMRKSRRYRDMRPLIRQDGAGGVVNSVGALDELLDANARLRQALREHAAPGVVTAADQSYFADAMGIFSRDVRIVTVRVSGNTAEVQYQQGGRLPLLEARLVRSGPDAAWHFDPQQRYSDELAEALRRIAATLRNFADALKEGSIAGTEPEVLLRRLRGRL